MLIKILNNSIEFSAENLNLRHAIKNGLNIAVNMREALKENAEKLKPFAKDTVEVVLDTPYMLVPEDELSTSRGGPSCPPETTSNGRTQGSAPTVDVADKLFRATIATQSSEAVLRNPLPDLQAEILFSIDSDLKLVIEDNFPRHSFSHSCETLWLQNRATAGLVVSIRNKNLDLFAFHQNRFRFANRFPLQSDDDIVFLVLSVWKQLPLNQLKDKLLLLGESETAPEELMEKLKQFIEKIEYTPLNIYLTKKQKK